MLLPCGCQCKPCGCKAGKLPPTITATFSGLDSKTKGPFCNLSFCSTFGSGAAAVATGPGGCDGEYDPVCGTKTGENCSTYSHPPSDRGPLTGVLLTSPGACYAKLGRVEPTLTASIPPGDGSGAELTVNIEPLPGECDSWCVQSIEVSGGCGYPDGGPVIVSRADGDVAETSAVAFLRATREEPEISASVSGGSGCVLAASLTGCAFGIASAEVPTWLPVEYGDELQFYADSGVETISPARAVIRTRIEMPEIDPGFEFTATLTERAFPDGRPYWTVTGLTLTPQGAASEGGSVCGYRSGYIYGNNKGSGLIYRVTRVDENGHIADWKIIAGGMYWKDTGEIEMIDIVRPGEYRTLSDHTVEPTVTGKIKYVDASVTLKPVKWGVQSVSINSPGSGYQDGSQVAFSVAGPGCPACEDSASAEIVADEETGAVTSVEVTAGGQYYAGGAPTSIFVENGGRYYRESKDAEPCVADIGIAPCGRTSTWSSDSASEWRGDYGVLIEPTVDSDVHSAGFGTVTALSIAEAGDGVLAWRWEKTCRHRMNGVGLVLRATTPLELTSLRAEACYGTGFCGRIVPTGKREQPKVCITGGGTGGTISATLTQHYEDANEQLPYWSISSVSATGGSGYGDSEDAVIHFSYGTTIDEPPAVTLLSAGGSLTGATIGTAGKFYLGWEYDGQPTAIKKVAVTSPGEGYARIGREAPTITLSAAGGSGATLTPSLSRDEDECGLPFWSIGSVDASGGVGYSDGQAVTVSVSAGKTVSRASITLQVNEDGEVTGATVTDGGAYYRENPSLPPHVADVTVVIHQVDPSDGTGGEITAHVESRTWHPQFGQITSLTIDSAGSGYLLWGAPTDCRYHGPCGISLAFRGLDKKPWLTYGDAVYEATDAVDDCSSPPSDAVILHSGEGSVSLVAGGEWDSRARCPCDPSHCAKEYDPCAGDCESSIRPPRCRECVGDCDECNGCRYGCGCNTEGKCDLCSDYDCTGGPCPDGCECRDGKCCPPDGGQCTYVNDCCYWAGGDITYFPGIGSLWPYWNDNFPGDCPCGTYLGTDIEGFVYCGYFERIGCEEPQPQGAIDFNNCLDGIFPLWWNISWYAGQGQYSFCCNGFCTNSQFDEYCDNQNPLP